MIKLQNCKIVGDGIGYDEYTKQPEGVKRGDAAFIMSRGELMTFAKCPAKWFRGVEDGDTKSTEWGDLVDSMLLSPAKFEMKFAVAPAEYASGKPWNWNATACKEWREEKEAAGLTITTDKEMKKATTALESLNRNSDLMELVECSKTQVMVTGEYKDKETGLIIPLKALLDLVPDKSNARFGKTLGDFKTTKNAALFEFGRDINNHHYDAQAALYSSLHVGATGEDRVDWSMAVQESSDPYHSEVYILNGNFMEIGESKILKALQLYCWCLKNKTWPGYSLAARSKWNGMAIIGPEDWMMTRLADFCPIPDSIEIKQQNDGEITP